MHNKQGAPVSKHQLPPPLGCDSLSAPCTCGLNWKVWLEACTTDKQQELTTFICYLPCSAKG